MFFVVVFVVVLLLFLFFGFFFQFRGDGTMAQKIENRWNRQTFLTSS